MKKVALVVFLISIVVITGCTTDNKNNDDVTLEHVYDEVEKYFDSVDNENLASYYIQEDVIVIELADDSESEIEKIKSELKDYLDYIIIQKGGPYTPSNNNQ